MFKYIFCFLLSVFTSSSPCRKDQFAVSYCSAKWPCPSQLSYEDMKIIYVNCAVKNQMKDDHASHRSHIQTFAVAKAHSTTCSQLAW